MNRAFKIFKNNIVFFVALIAAIITCFFVPPDKEYLGYYDMKTLTCLFCTLAVVNGLKNIKFFDILAGKIVSVFKNTRSSIIALVYITFIGSMLIANDMALITFLPLGYFVLITTNNEKYMAFTFIMQNIAANLGGMLTPFGNPQNLFMYSYFNIPTMEFMKIMFLPFFLSVFLITLCCMVFVKKEPLNIKNNSEEKLKTGKTVYLLVLFAISIIVVFRIIPFYIGLVLILAGMFYIDRNALTKVDYPLLLTFCAFFTFSGNLARIPEINDTLGTLVRWNPLLVGVGSCQVISNVPTAILLSKFTTDYPHLLVAVNIGGTGTIIASLASLITFREYSKCMPDYMSSYMKKFTLFNFGFVIILTVIMYLVLI